ncbi:MAG: hypothetical protein HKN23_11250 [Verrucomicrobiales bacterium]|nr:hypothetical protein [Verrucomicrobiales bacterium]
MILFVSPLGKDPIPGLCFLGLFALGVIYLLVMSIIAFVKKRIAAGIATMICFFMALGLLVPALAYAFATSIDWDGQDDFATGLSLPAGVPLKEPGEISRDDSLNDGDRFQKAIRAAAAVMGGSNDAMAASIPSLEKLNSSHRAELEQYLACHPAWLVFEDRGKRFALRRWQEGGRWTKSLNGYYSDFSTAGAKFQSRTMIGLSGKPAFLGSQKLPANKLVRPKLAPGNGLQSCHLFFEFAPNLGVSLFEQSASAERVVTKAALLELEVEFAALLADPAGKLAELGEPGLESFEIENAFQGGIYRSRIRCNPGEPGRIYLKAFEITKGERLSADRLEKSTTEWVGWSNDPAEVFPANAQFTIYEGDWGQYYGGRFEVWFEPDSGGPERMLLEENYKIEGWMR